MVIRKYGLPLLLSVIVVMIGLGLLRLQQHIQKANDALDEGHGGHIGVDILTPTLPPAGSMFATRYYHTGRWHSVNVPDAEVPKRRTASKPPADAVTTPDFPAVDPNADPVAAAHKRLAYLKNNPYAWGGVHSERATELIAVLMPPPFLRDHAHGCEVDAQIQELIAQNDPRVAEVLITTLCEGSVSRKEMYDALVEIGPPALPYILHYLEKGIAGNAYIYPAVFESLGRIGERYRGDLGGIVDHILIPKLEAIAADARDEDFEAKYARFSAAVMEAQKALSRLQYKGHGYE